MVDFYGKYTLPETNIAAIAPENGCLQYFLVSFWKTAYFSGAFAVSCRGWGGKYTIHTIHMDPMGFTSKQRKTRLTDPWILKTLNYMRRAFKFTISCCISTWMEIEYKLPFYEAIQDLKYLSLKLYHGWFIFSGCKASYNWRAEKKHHFSLKTRVFNSFKGTCREIPEIPTDTKIYKSCEMLWKELPFPKFINFRNLTHFETGIAAKTPKIGPDTSTMIA